VSPLKDRKGDREQFVDLLDFIDTDDQIAEHDVLLPVCFALMLRYSLAFLVPAFLDVHGVR
jgi:hypothetical protein